ncbi:hypothetical protein O1L60_03115 [Streptomyces diastatochromogenes]|nr:hypothetical protein [Streptomyces diastatochromogenes]
MLTGDGRPGMREVLEIVGWWAVLTATTVVFLSTVSPSNCSWRGRRPRRGVRGPQDPPGRRRPGRGGRGAVRALVALPGSVVRGLAVLTAALVTAPADATLRRVRPGPGTGPGGRARCSPRRRTPACSTSPRRRGPRPRPAPGSRAGGTGRGPRGRWAVNAWAAAALVLLAVPAPACLWVASRGSAVRRLLGASLLSGWPARCSSSCPRPTGARPTRTSRWCSASSPRRHPRLHPLRRRRHPHVTRFRARGLTGGGRREDTD